MVEFAVSVINQIGLVGAAFLIAIEVIVMPIPSELVLLLSGFNASTGSFTLLGAIIATTIGSLAGASILYSAGYLFTEERLEHLISRYGKYLGISLKDFQKTIGWFERHGSALVFFGRLIPIIRSLVSIPAGLVKMNYFKFLFFTTLGSGIWNTLWISIGFVLGDNWKMAEQYADIIDYIAYSAIALAIIYLVIRAIRFRKPKSLAD